MDEDVQGKEFGFLVPQGMTPVDVGFAIAYHEAGHGIVAHHLGFQVETVSIEPKAHEDGTVSAGYVITDVSEPHVIDDRVCVLLAGPMAEKRRTGRRATISAQDEAREAYEVLLEAYFESEWIAEDRLMRLRRRTGRILTRFWPCVENLALQLLIKTPVLSVDPTSHPFCAVPVVPRRGSS